MKKSVCLSIALVAFALGANATEPVKVQVRANSQQQIAGDVSARLQRELDKLNEITLFQPQKAGWHDERFVIDLMARPKKLGGLQGDSVQITVNVLSFGPDQEIYDLTHHTTWIDFVPTQSLDDWAVETASNINEEFFAPANDM